MCANMYMCIPIIIIRRRNPIAGVVDAGSAFRRAPSSVRQCLRKFSPPRSRAGGGTSAGGRSEKTHTCACCMTMKVIPPPRPLVARVCMCALMHVPVCV